LVICDPMQGFEVKGWCYGIEAMTPEWHMTGEGRPHWRYKGRLRPFSTLTLEPPATLARPLPADPWCLQ
jgi:hypothetical protein